MYSHAVYQYAIHRSGWCNRFTLLWKLWTESECAAVCQTVSCFEVVQCLYFKLSQFTFHLPQGFISGFDSDPADSKVRLLCLFHCTISLWRVLQ
jgi:hypothetical protein